MQGSGSLKIFCDSDTGIHWHSIPAIGDGPPSAHWHDSVLLDELTFRVDFHINKVWRRDKYLLMLESGAHPKSVTFPENEWWCQSREIHHVDHFLLRADVISSPPFSFRSPGNETKL